MCLMPDHVHVVVGTDQQGALVEAARAFARGRSWRGDRGRLWETVPPAEALVDRDKQRRTVRYVHLNPCRARLVDCPLAWPLSTYRDLLGLAAAPVVRRAADPVAYHAWTSADGSTRAEGTPMPGSVDRLERLDLQRLAGAVSEWRRVPLARLLDHRLERTWLLAAARTMTTWSGAGIARAYGVSGAAVSRARTLRPEEVAVLARLVADPRTPGLVARDPRLLAWRPRPWPRR